MEKYNSTQDTNLHRAHIQNFMKRTTLDLVTRSREHDKSKLYKPEKDLYDTYGERLNTLEYGSEEYQDCLKEMMDLTLPHHYEHNDHHPEHFENGINDMNLIQLIEMVCDWMGSVAKKFPDCKISEKVLFDINQERFGYSDEVKQILINTVKYIEDLRKM